MELYQQITFGIILLSLVLRGLKLIASDKELSLTIASDIGILVAIIILLIFIDVSGLKTFCICTSILVILYLIFSIAIHWIEKQFEKEDDKIYDN